MIIVGGIVPRSGAGVDIRGGRAWASDSGLDRAQIAALSRAASVPGRGARVVTWGVDKVVLKHLKFG